MEGRIGDSLILQRFFRLPRREGCGSLAQRMTAGQILRFQFGRRDAIASAARGSGTLWTGAGLTLTAAIARNYDQTWIGETPLWLFGNLLFSLISSFLIFSIVSEAREGCALPRWSLQLDRPSIARLLFDPGLSGKGS